MTFPAPSLPLWGLGLLLFGLAVATLGECVRQLLARRVPLLRSTDPIERGLLDLYLGGAALYALAAVQVPWFYPGTVTAVLLAGGIGLIAAHLLRGDRADLRARVARVLAPLRRAPYWLTLAAVAALFIVELSAVSDVGSGNTFDASLLATYTGLLLSHHTLPLTLAPVAQQALAYPQGTTVWLAAAQGLFALPPLRTSLLVTPLFLSLAPAGGFVLGRRVIGTDWAGAAIALVLALLAPFSRGLVAGSNDFVFALPLVLLLAAWSAEWLGPTPPRLSTSLAFGALAGYAAALNPVGPVWLFLLLPILSVLTHPRFGGSFRGWAVRWIQSVALSLVLVLPSLIALVGAPSSAGVVASSTSGGALPATGLNWAQFVGAVDPFLFRPQDQALSPFPLLRAELALLLVAGIVLLAIGRRRFALPTGVARFAVGSVGVAIVLLATGVAAQAGVEPFRALFRLTSAAELAILLFVLFSVVAAIPLVVAANALSVPQGRPSRLVLPALVALVILLPGVAVTTGPMPGQLHQVYLTFANESTADVDFLEWAGSHLPQSSRVIVAPGSVAEFLPAYDPSVELLYPMSVGFLTSHPSYWLVIHELQNGTLDRSGWNALQGLGGTYLAVTENNTALFRPLEPGPLLAAQIPVVFQEGGVYLFDVSGPLPSTAASNVR